MTGSLRVVGGSVDVAISAGVVVDGGAGGPVYDASGLTVLPGLIDLQVNGAAGIDLTREPARLWEVAAALPAYGVTAFLPTIITSSPAARAVAMETLAAGPPVGWAGARPLGLHFEGPMIAPARKGAHPPAWLVPPSAELVAGWSWEAGVALVTVAPELPGALDVVSTLVSAGVVVAVGHTEASAEQVAAAVDRGARAVTHLGNAMPALAGRAPGPVGAALADPRLVAGVIADGHHLHPTTLAAWARALGPSRLLAVTDCTAALGMPDGPSRLGDQAVVVREGTVRLEDGTLAGSAASLPECLRMLRAATGWSLDEVVGCCTSVAADLLGDAARGRLAPGARGDLTVVDADLDVVATVVGGRLVHGSLEER
ncbi:N-acetylglucosamine-6-phosphate deacetylase [Nocardioides nitrophenolicus]|uniref:N-acetylglucosamine-6-phosphate deacetylase n=1 Tax=Nocardioides nitrophenolicus TaxID=60489 RepID=UPI0027DE0CF0|nr:N-acetylglucosamine-6-phosphate deacetylase [Nocardioides nitrophenolicus]MBM7516189.1 N-acetylglucosamine-6-phosphate deacetylase [Nocardioides nitrophenolicus]